MKKITVLFLLIIVLFSYGSVQGEEIDHYPRLFPITDSGPIFPREWIVAAGEVVDYSANVDKNAPVDPSKIGKNEECWIKIKVVKPITGVQAGKELTVYFIHKAVSPGSPARYKLLSQEILFCGGEKLLAVVEQRNNRLRFIDDIYPISGYDVPPVKAMEEFARWDTLNKEQQLKAMADTVLHSTDEYLSYNTIGIYVARARALSKRAEALDTLLNRGKGNKRYLDIARCAFNATYALYDINEKEGISAQLISLYEERLFNDTTERAEKLDILDILRRCGYGSRRVRADEPYKQVFRPKVLRIIERFINSTTDQDLLRSAKEHRDQLLENKKDADEVVED